MKFRKIQMFFILIIFSISAYSQLAPPSNIFQKTLSNGLSVMVVEDHSVPLATIEIAVKNGSYTESPEYNGLSHLYEHMFFKANNDYPNQEAFLDKIKSLGIIYNGTTGTERVNYFFTLPSFNLHEGLKFINSAIQHPLFDTAEMKKENVVVDGEFQRQESSPFFALRDTLAHAMYGENYSRKNGIGNHDIILTATPEKMVTIKNKYYWPDNSLLIVGGDVEHEAVFTDVEKVMENWKPAGFDPFERYPIPEFKMLDSSSFKIVVSENARIPFANIMWFGPDTRHDEKGTYVADVFSYILSQNSSKLSKALVDSGLALQVNLSYFTQKYGGPISLSVVPNPAKVKECMEEAFRQVNQFADEDYFTDAQLATAKQQLEIGDIRGKEITSNYVHTLSFWWASASFDYYFSYIDNLKKISREDIRDYVRKYILNKPFVAGLVISPAMDQQMKPSSFFNKNLLK